MEVSLMTKDQGVLTSSSSVSASLISSELDCNTANTAWLLSRITNDMLTHLHPNIVLGPQVIISVFQVFKQEGRTLRAIFWQILDTIIIKTR